jgi:hypothetical protein
MIRFAKFLPILAVLAGVVILGAPRPAHAYIEIDYAIDGGAKQFGASSTTSAVTWSNSSVGGDFNVLFTIGTTNTPGGTQALVTQSNNAVSTLYSSGTHTLKVYVSSTGFTAPSIPSEILGTASSITENGGHTDVTFKSVVDQNNTLFGGVAGVGAGDNTTSNSVTYSANGQAGGGTSTFTPFTLSSTPYALTNEGDYKMDAGTSLTVVSGNTTVSPVPAPAGIVLALTGLPCLGIAGWLRRRGQQAA